MIERKSKNNFITLSLLALFLTGSFAGGGYFLAQKFRDREILKTDATRVASENWSDYADTNWAGSGTAENPFQIDTPEKLAGIAKSSHATTYGGTYNVFYKQTADINLAGRDWKPLYCEGGFRGNFNGNNFTIRGMFVDGNISGGLFDYVWRGELYNIALKDSVIKTEADDSGGLVCRLEWGKVINCSSDCQVYYVGTVVGSGICHGGIVGNATYGSVIQNCVNYGNVKTVNNVADMGGIVGKTNEDDGTTGPVKIIDCINYGTIESGGFYIGGIAGSINHGTIIYGCHNYGNIIAKKFGAGGIVGYSDDGNIRNCIQNAMVSSKDYVGGILGSSWSESGVTSIENCAVNGLLFLDGFEQTSYVGGVLGGMQNRTKPLNIINCSVNVVCNQPAQVFAGYTEELTGLKIDSCYGQANSMKQYTSGDFAEFCILPRLNKGLPVHRSFYHVAQFAPEFDLAWFNENGYSKIY